MEDRVADLRFDRAARQIVVRPMFLPDRFVNHGAPNEQYRDAALEADHIVEEVFQALNHDSKILELKAKA